MINVHLVLTGICVDVDVPKDCKLVIIDPSGKERFSLLTMKDLKRIEINEIPTSMPLRG